MFGERIKSRRIKKSLTQAQLAQLSGISRTTLSKLECGACKGNLKQAIALARALETSIDFLIGLTDVDQRHPLK